MNKLYPIRFHPVYKDKVWGGTRLKNLFGKNYEPLPNCGESWEISGVKDSVSVVSNGFLRDNSLEELMEVYMGDLVGDKVFGMHGKQFPLLLKFIDTTQALSIQVHPDSAMALERHQSYGKTEMWYVLHAEPDAEIIVGFKDGVDKDTYQHHVKNNTIRDILNVEKAFPGDVFFIPAGHIHAIGAGITLCEIQQSSDVTYRVYDWDRPGVDGKLRELHLDEALDAIDFSKVDAFKTPYKASINDSTKLVSCEYFTTNLMAFDRKIECDYFYLDSFVIYVCVEGALTVVYSQGKEHIMAGDTVLLPAEIKQVELLPDKPCKVLEVYIK
jgi:mannose-6-phosphate isomerase